MKKVFSFAVTILMISFAIQAGPSVLKGKTYCALGDFKIEKAKEAFVLNGETLETYTVSYENSPKTVRIAVLKERKCCRYLVLSDDLKVQYLRNDHYFGVDMFRDKQNKLGLDTNIGAMDINGYYHQKVISREETGKANYLKLIAVFYPKLLKNYEKVFECS